MSEIMSDTDESLYRVSYILTENSQFQCPVCFEEFLREDEVQNHMSQYNHYEATTVFIKSEKGDSEEEIANEEVEEQMQIDENLLEEKIQNQVMHALSNIEKLTHQIVQEQYIEDDSNSNEDISGHLQVELKTDAEVAGPTVEDTELSVEGDTELCVEDQIPKQVIKRIKSHDYTCELCPLKFAKRHLLKIHMKEHEGDLNYCCDICQKTFTFKQQLNTHRKCHLLERKFKCMTCNKSYKFKQQLNLHVLTHSGIKPFTCETCHKCFTLERQLQSHSKVHTTIKPFVCAQCGKCFKIKQQLQNHELTHYDIKPFSCDACGKSFKLKQQLQNHQKVHEDFKPYSCDRCGKSFKFKQQLQNHGKIHDGIKQFQCEFCEKEFMFKQQLQIHMKIHFGIKEFPCHLCPKDFRTKQQLQKHLEMHERKYLRLNDKSDDGLSEISTISNTDRDAELLVEQNYVAEPEPPVVKQPEVIVASSKDSKHQQKFIILKRAPEVSKLLEGTSKKIPTMIRKPLQDKFEIVQKQEIITKSEVDQDGSLSPQPVPEKSVIVETIESCMLGIDKVESDEEITMDAADLNSVESQYEVVISQS